MIRFPWPLTVPEVDPDPDTTCTLTPLNVIVGWPSIPLSVYDACDRIDALTAVVPDPQPDADEPPETAGCPAVVGTQRNSDAADASAKPTTKMPAPVATSAAASARAPLNISTPLDLVLGPVLKRPLMNPRRQYLTAPPGWRAG